MNRAATLDRTLAALADPHRRRVVELLGRQPRSAGELAVQVSLSPAALSRHLRTLKVAGLVIDSHPANDARIRIYELRAAPMADLRNWAEKTEALWIRQLAAFKAHVESIE